MKNALTIYLLPEIKKAGKELAASKGISLSSFISLLISEERKKLYKEMKREILISETKRKLDKDDKRE